MASTKLSKPSAEKPGMDVDLFSSNVYIEKGTNRVLPIGFATPEVVQHIEDFQVYDDDVLIVTLPKSGTHWMQETLCCLLHGMDFEKLKSPEYQRSYNIELKSYNNSKLATGPSYDSLERPRVLKTHLIWSKLPKAFRDPNCKAKIIYVARNPKDACVSMFYFLQMVPGERNAKKTESFDAFADAFLRDKFLFLPYWDHLLDFWKRRDNPNVFFVKYEEMKANLPKVLDRLQAFLNLDPLTEKQREEITSYLSFDQMKSNESVQDFMQLRGSFYSKKYTHTGEDANFMRKGQSGQWKTTMSPELIKKFDDWILKNTAGTGYSVDVD